MWSANYFQQEQVHPGEDEEPSEVQVKGLDTRISLGRTPYVDFGIFGPYGRKLMRALRLRTWVPNGDGSFTAKEVPGPENFSQFTIIWKVFRASCLMLRCVMGFALKLYYENLERLLKLWPECWHLIYIADDRMRSEQMERIRREIAVKITNGQAPPAHWDPNRPWTAVFLAAAADKDYWDEHVKNIATSWLAHGARGAPKAPEEEFAQLHLPGMRKDLQTPGDRSSRKATSRSRSKVNKEGKGKRKRKRQQDRLKEKLRQAEADAKRKRSRTRSRSRNKNRGRNKPTGGSGDTNSQACYSFSKSYGACKDCEPGSSCAAGRQHKCHLCGGAHKAAACPKKKKKG